LILVILLALGFRTSNALAAAYGIAVTGTMLITTCMLAFLTFSVWRWNRLLAGITTGGFLFIDGLYFASNATKIPDGGWFPLLVAAIVFTLLTTWSKGREIVRRYLQMGMMDIDLFLSSTASRKRIAGTAVFRSSTVEGVPPA